MKNVVVLMLVVISCIACRQQTVLTTTSHSESASQTPSPTPVPAQANESEAEINVVPPGFTHVDFKNLSYQTNLSGKVKLQDGRRVIENPEGGGGDTFELRAVDYADIDGNGAKEAIVRLLVVSCGGSCDGGSHLFYFFSNQRGKIKLITRFETGSIAYECGLKSFVLKGRELELELFRNCRLSGVSFLSLYSADDHGGKFEAHEFTRFRFEFHGSRLVKKKRELLPFPPGDVRNYQEVVNIN